MARITAIANQKGGIGKTTTAHALSAGLASRGFKVLAVDADQQGNLSHSMEASTSSRGLYEAMTGEAIEGLIQHTRQGDVLASSSRLTKADKEFSDFTAAYLLKEALEPIKGKYQFIVIDCPPQLGIMVINSLVAATGIIIPCTSDLYSIMGLAQLLSTVESVRKHGNSELNIEGILLTRYSGRTILSRDLKDSIESKAAELGAKLYTTVIREGVSVREAQTSRKDIFTFSPKSNPALDYDSFINEYLEGGLVQ
jgi:chromosome partitioning protein